jgi:oligosaccharide repeat unit polymerase
VGRPETGVASLILTLAYLLLAGAWIRLNRILFEDPVSPFNMLLFSWLGPLALRSYGLSDQERSWPLELILIVLWVTAALALPVLAIRPRRGATASGEARRVFTRLRATMRTPLFLWLIGVMYALSFVAYLYNEFITNPIGIPLLSFIRDPTLALGNYHRWGKEEGRTFALYLSLPVQVLVPMLYLGFRENAGRARRWLLLALALAYPFMAALKLSRSDILYAVMAMALVEYYYRRFTRTGPGRRMSTGTMLRYGALGAVLVVVLNAFLFIRAGLSPLEGGFATLIGLKVHAGPFTSPLGEVYGYFALPFENFANIFRRYSGGLEIGVGPLRPLLSVTGQSALAERLMARIDLENVLLYPINTYTFLTLTYVELGLVGVLVVPLVYGVAIGYLYARFRRHPTLTWMFLYLTFVPCWLWLFVTNGFSVLSMYLNAAFVILLFLIYRVVVVAGGAVPADLREATEAEPA